MRLKPGVLRRGATWNPQASKDRNLQAERPPRGPIPTKPEGRRGALGTWTKTQRDQNVLEQRSATEAGGQMKKPREKL